MKKINSINYGGKVLMIGSIAGIVIPVVLWLVSCIWNNPVLLALIKLFFMAGIVIFFFFIIHLVIELHQDKKIEKYYSSHKNVKIQISNGSYECGACGCRPVNKEDTFCRVCGIQFEQCSDKLPQDILDSRKK